MKDLGKLLLFGFLSWLMTFAGALCLSPLRTDIRTTFETLVGVILTVSTVLFTTLYFRQVRQSYLRAGILLGTALVFCNILLDLPMFLAGPMQMRPWEYMKDIGLAYLSMPAIAIGCGYMLQKRVG